MSASGHYLLPLNQRKQIIVDSDRNSKMNITLYTKSFTPKEVATKLHEQFAHPPAAKLINLVKTQPGNQSEIIKAIKKVSKKCKICLEFKRPPPRPVVALPLANQFGQVVAMDLKQFGKVHLLHMIDVATRFSAGAVITSKQPDLIVKKIFTHWISVFGTPEKFLSDNGGEFNNPILRELCEKCNIIVLTTAAESPWSNGLVECHNRILGDMITKTMAESKCTLEMAVMWCLSAHNSLRNVHGFSPFQLVFSKNPTIPVLQNAKPPALHSETSSEIIRKNLNALHKAREAFISSENSERLKRALRHNIRTSGGSRFYTNDKVYYKRMDSKHWKGPGTVLGQDNKQVLIKHGGVYVRVHPCRVSLVKKTHYATKHENTENMKQCVNEENSGRNANVIESTDDEVLESESSENESSENESSENESSVNESSENGRSENENSEHESNINEDSENENDESTGQGELVGDNNRTNKSDNTYTTENKNEQQQPKQVGRPRKVHKMNGPEKNLKFKNGMILQVKFKQGKDWEKVKLVSRSGKVGGKYENEWNTILNNTKPKVIDFNRDIQDYIINMLEQVPEDENENQHQENENDVTHEIFYANTEDEILEAKLEELESWKRNKVYKEVEDTGQDTISIKWVLKEKKLEEKIFMKARLVLRGYEEMESFRTDSPTCRRESVRLALTILASKKWKARSIDFKTAYLQGEPIERNIFIIPPKEANTNKLWKLLKTVYGLNDAPRQWYFSLLKVLTDLGCQRHSIDHGFFYCHKDNQMIGLLLTYVDDILWGGNEKFAMYVIEEIRQKLYISHEHETAFTYIGIMLRQQRDFTICIDQYNYIDSLTQIILKDNRLSEKQSVLNAEELKAYRSTIGQLGWLAGISRPDISFHVGAACSTVPNATVQDVLEINKVVRHVKNTKSVIKFKRLPLNPEKLLIVLYSDASYKNLPNGGSQGGHIVFLSDGLNCIPLAWHSTRIRRTVRSSTSAEMLALLDGCDTAFLMSKLVSEVYTGNRTSSIPIECYVDNRNLHDAAYGTTPITDQYSLVDLSIIRERIKSSEIKVKWIHSRKQLADVLTKKGASHEALLKVLQNGTF